MYAIIFHHYSHWDITNPACQLGLNAYLSPVLDKYIRGRVRDQPFYGWKDIEWNTPTTSELVNQYIQNVTSVESITYSHW